MTRNKPSFIIQLALIAGLLLGACQGIKPAATVLTATPNPSSGQDHPQTPVPSPDQPANGESPTTTLPVPQSPRLGEELKTAVGSVSLDRMLATIKELSEIRPYAGWRNSGTPGEKEGLDLMQKKVESLAFLKQSGLAIERQEFHVDLATVIRSANLEVMVDGKPIQVTAEGLRGSRDFLIQTLRFDSDGKPNDDQSNPRTVGGTVAVVRDAEDVDKVTQGGIAMVDYALLDYSIRSRGETMQFAMNLLDKKPAGVVAVTQFSNEKDASHGTFVGDGGTLGNVPNDWVPVTIFVRLEDLAPAGIKSWDDLKKITRASLTLDADVFAPGTSGNLVVHIPGIDPSRAVVLGAHIDSANNPGAMDDGSGSAALLEAATVLDEAQTRPPVDLYLVWFGSEEIALNGSETFAATHSDILSRTVGMVQIDCLSHPLDGVPAELGLIYWPVNAGDPYSQSWASYLQDQAGQVGVQLLTEGVASIYSDNNSVGGFGVPNLDVIYEDEQAMSAIGGVWYAGHIHDPYDTVDLARDSSAVLKQMGQVAVVAAFKGGDFQLTAVVPLSKRAVFIASHTEDPHMTPASLTQLGLTLRQAGFKVEVVPYGKAATADDLKGAQLVFALPVYDYPWAEDTAPAYDEAWTAPEVGVLKAYVDQGGLLVVTNTARRMKFLNATFEPNEDWGKTNALGQAFGVTFRAGSLKFASASVSGSSPLMTGVSTVQMVDGNGVPFYAAGGEVLARAGDEPVLALVSFGQSGGQVLVAADLGIFGDTPTGPLNLSLWQNLADYAAKK